MTGLAIDIGSCSGRAWPSTTAAIRLTSSATRTRGSDQDELVELVRSVVDGLDAASSRSCRSENI
jgi:hypothetical protein